jgi:hypothetical protein
VVNSARILNSQFARHAEEARTIPTVVSIVMTDPCYGENCQVLADFYSFFFFILEASFLFFSGLPDLLQQIWLAFSGSAQVSMTWLNLLSVQPPRAHIISFPRLAREAHRTHSLKRAIKGPGVSTGSVTLQIVRGKIIS